MSEHLEDHYELQLPLGSNPLGTVWQAQPTRGGRVAAVAVLSVEDAGEAEAERLRQGFTEAARALGGIRHAALAEVFDTGTTREGAPYMAMELLQGTPLGQRLAERPALSVEQVCSVASQILEALEQVHGAGLVHGDIEPWNILVQQDRQRVHAKLIGFGLNRAQARSGRGPGAEAAKDEGLLRSLAYMSPEQARCEHDVDSRTDLFSLGTVLYEALSGRLPFSGATAAEVRAVTAAGRPPPLHRARREIAGALGSSTARALSAERERRFADAASMRKALRTALLVAPKVAKLTVPVAERGDPGAAANMRLRNPGASQHPPPAESPPTTKKTAVAPPEQARSERKPEHVATIPRPKLPELEPEPPPDADAIPPQPKVPTLDPEPPAPAQGAEGRSDDATEQPEQPTGSAEPAPQASDEGPEAGSTGWSDSERPQPGETTSQLDLDELELVTGDAADLDGDDRGAAAVAADDDDDDDDDEGPTLVDDSLDPASLVQAAQAEAAGVGAADPDDFAGPPPPFASSSPAGQRADAPAVGMTASSGEGAAAADAGLLHAAPAGPRIPVRLLSAGIGCGVLLGTALAVLIILATGSDEGDAPTEGNGPSAEATVDPGGTEPAGAASPPPASEPPGAAQDAGAAAAEAPSGEPDASTEDAPPATVRVRLLGLPDGAAIRLDGSRVDGADFELPRDEGRHVIEVRADGYEPWRTELQPDEDVELEPELEARAPPARSEPRTKRPRKSRPPPSSRQQPKTSSRDEPRLARDPGF